VFKCVLVECDLVDISNFLFKN